MKSAAPIYFACSLILISACAKEPVKEEDRLISSLQTRQLIIDEFDTAPISRQQVIDNYRELVKITSKDQPSGIEARRLADLELESSLDNRDSDDALKVKQAKLEAADAISRYQRYLEDNPEGADNDQVLYQLSKAYAIENQPGKSQKAMDQMLALYAESDHADEILFRHGENLFVDREYRLAETSYAQVVNKYPSSQFFQKSLYKLGWSQFRQNQYQSALNNFLRLLDQKFDEGEITDFSINDQLSAAEQELVDDILRVVSLNFTYLPEKNPIYYQLAKQPEKPYEALLYRNLGEHYQRKKRYLDAAEIFLEYGRLNPVSEHSANLHSMAIDTYKKNQTADLLLESKINFVQLYNVDTKYWTHQRQAHKKQLTRLLKKHIRDIADHYFALARTSKKPQNYLLPVTWYKRYLKSFPQAIDANDVHYLLAESLLENRQFLAAIDAFETTAYQYPTHKNSAEAAYSGLLTFPTLIKIAKAEDKNKYQHQQIESALKFSDTFSDDKRVPALLINTSQQLYQFKLYAVASATAIKVINNTYSTQPMKLEGWQIRAHSAYELAQFADAEKAYIQVYERLPKKSKQRQITSEKIAASIYKQGEVLNQQGQGQLAAVQFLRLGKVVPNSPKRKIAEYDAATAYIQNKNWAKAIPILEAFRSRYPKDKKYAQGITEKLALAYQQDAKPGKAANEMMALSTTTKSKVEHKALLLQSAELYQTSGQQKKSIEIWKTYIKSYPYPLDQSIELRYKITEFYRTQKDNNSLNFWQQQIVKAHDIAGPNRTKRSLFLAANASMELIKPIQLTYKNSHLNIPLKKSLKKKKKLMKQLLKSYKKASDYRVQEVSTAATFQIAETYRDFAEALLKSQRPKDLDGEALEEYDLLLEDQAFPFEEKAIKIHQNNLKRMPKGIYDQWIKRSLNVMSKIQPFRYAKYEVTESFVDE